MTSSSDDVAVVGMSGVFPGSPDLETFWQHLEQEHDLITEVPKSRWDWKAFFGDQADPNIKTDSKWGGFVDRVDAFDADFFAISPREAELMDPQHRLFLQTAWQAIERGGEAPASLSGKAVGVFAGMQFREYEELLALRGISHAYGATGNGHAMLSNRISYLLNLRGPSESIDTACSSALVAMNRAVQSLQRGECCSAIVGAVSLMLSPGTFVGTSKMKVLSPDGRCKTFDASANGYVKGEGVGVLYLKRLVDAERDRNPILCVIRGVAVNHGGRAQSLTAPNAAAQKELLVQTYAQAGMSPDTIGYIEAHGTGTELGDPVEIEGLKAAFAELSRSMGRKLPNQAYCGVGSVKTNIGHLEPAAGIAGVIKVILAMQHQILPASLHLKRLNPFIKLENSPFFIVDKTQPWTALLDENGRALPRRAGVSSFGFGGSNAHVVLEEYQGPQERQKSHETEAQIAHLVTLSAKTETALAEQIAGLNRWLQKHGESHSLADIAFTLNVGRGQMPVRCGMVVNSISELAKTLESLVQETQPPHVFKGSLNHSEMPQRPLFKQLLAQILKDLPATVQDAGAYREKLLTLADLYVEGYAPDWVRLYPEGIHRRLPLPAYPFEKQRYWVPEAEPALTVARHNTPNLPVSPGSKPAIELLGYRQEWMKVPNRPISATVSGLVLVLDVAPEFSLLIARRTGTVVIRVSLGASYEKVSDELYRIRVDEKEDYQRLVREVSQQGRIGHLIHCWSRSNGNGHAGTFAENYQRNLLSMMLISQALIGPGRKDALRLMFGCAQENELDRSWCGAVSGLLKSLKLEHPAVEIRTIECEDWEAPQSAERWIQECFFEAGTEHEVRLRKGDRWVKCLKEIPMDPVSVASKLKKRGVYLITGGAGGLGRLFADYLTDTVQAKLVLTGRSDLDDQRRRWLDRLKARGAEVLYLQGDVGVPDDVERMVSQARQSFGRIDGIIHAAGIPDYGRLAEKGKDILWAVMSPKAAGAGLLDRATQDEPLDFFALFSSLSAVIGVSEGSAYAAANAFLDDFVGWRERQRTKGARQGKTLSFNWPLWREGGMKMAENASAQSVWEDWLLKSQSLVPLETASGLKAFEQGLQLDSDHLIVLEGLQPGMRKTLERGLGIAFAATSEAGVEAATLSSSFVAATKLDEALTDHVCELLKVPREKIRSDKNLSEFGFDSISLKAFADQLNDAYGLSLMPSVFFAHPTIKALSVYLRSNFESAIRKAVSLDAAGPKQQAPAISVPSNANVSLTGEFEPIAVVGMSGIFPSSPDLETFWEHLIRSDDLIGEVPPERWDWKSVLGNGASAIEANAIRSGGFIQGVDQFDAHFFGISRREAEMMDPQHRLMLQTVWRAIEDAGEAPASLAGRSVGLFVGVQFNDYRDLLILRGIHHPYVATGNGHPLLPNRISYLLNLLGPSEAIDTACSSSLVALNRAVRALQARECDAAVAGGVSLLFSPGTLIGAQQLGVLSPDGRCKTFDASANGYVKGEGVGAVYLMRLRDAEAGGYPIAGVIKGCAVNHGGKAQSFTAPNELAQRDLLVRAYSQAGIDPETIGYIEAHGTGTELGDPVEVEGLKAAFEQLARMQGRAIGKTHYCGIGSIKTNIGHLEPAAGIAGVIKVLLALRHKTLPGTLHFNRLNPFIRLDQSPFFVVDHTRPWETLMDRNGNPSPRRAGVSSFGYGGANAHVVLEEYCENGDGVLMANAKPGRIIAFSAKTSEALSTMLSDFEDWLARTSKSLDEISYTRNLGRDHFECRAAFVVSSVAEFRFALAQLREGRPPSQLLRSPDSISKPEPAFEALRRQLQTELSELRADDKAHLEKLKALADLYVKGYDLDWKLLHRGENGRRARLPGYPFKRERYWIPKTELAAPETNGIPETQPENGLLSYCKPVWVDAPLSASRQIQWNGPILIFDSKDESITGRRKSLKSIEVIQVTSGPAFARLKPDCYQIRPDQYSDYEKLFDALAEQGISIRRILHAWSRATFSSRPECLEDQIQTSLQSLFCLVKALARRRDKTEVQLVFSFESNGSASEPIYESATAFLKVAKLEHPRIVGRVVAVEGTKLPECFERILQEFGEPFDQVLEIRSGAQVRLVRNIEPLNLQASAAKQMPMREGGVYWITGGAGALGLIFAEYLITACRARIVLTGRSPVSNEITRHIERLERLGGGVIYRQCDISNRSEVEKTADAIRVKWGGIHGVIHAAGCLQDGLIEEKDFSQFRTVLAPKVLGLANIDETTREDSLDWMVLFSSLSSVFGNLGQSDYAASNGFLDGFAAWRERERAAGSRKGRTISINWPYWKQGGMRSADSAAAQDAWESWMRDTLHLAPLSRENGLRAFEACLAGNCSQVIVLEKLSDKKGVIEQSASAVPKTAITSEDLDHLTEQLMEDARELLKADAGEIGPSINFRDMGFDSIGLKLFSQHLCDRYAIKVAPTTLFAYPTCSELAAHLAEVFPAVIVSAVPASVKVAESVAPSPPSVDSITAAIGDVAIIGMAGKFPQSPDLKAYWDHLRRGDSCITEVPPDRWDWKFFDSDDRSQASIASKWGGFIEGIDRFDAQFFGISPIEAEAMDPQERLFLETSWAAIEDAGYTPDLLAGASSKVGVFVGVTHVGYGYLGATSWAQGKAVNATSVHWSIANRVSYTFNFKGPSMALDTGCSSSLTAIHQAYESLRHGQCDVAVAGGVHLIVHPLQYVGLSAMRLLSKGNLTKSFGQGGDGFVNGEGVGAILLKPLSKALADGDHIYGIIKGSAINAGGRSNGYMVPNPQAHRELVKQALEDAKVDPHTITYIEAHGTGTEFGDAVEVRGLVEAFQASNGKSNGTHANNGGSYCALGSVKPNIGHLEAASGVSAIIKVLLQLKHKQLPPLLQQGPINPYIELENSPFYLQKELKEWTPIILARNDRDKVVPRRAAVSSFGAGGANAHIILEEAPAVATRTNQEKPAFLLTLSGKSLSALQRRMRDLADWVEREGEKHSLEDVSFSLNAGRCHFAYRCAAVVQTLDELKDVLRALGDGRPHTFAAGPDKISTGSQKNGVLKGYPDHKLDAATYRQRLTAMAADYVRGHTPDWEAFHKGETKRRIPLPTYPFEGRSHWASADHIRPQAPSPAEDPKAETQVPAPIPRNTTDIQLIQIWENILGVTGIGIRDDFFKSGGNSLRAVRLLQEIETQFQQTLPLNILFAASTIESLSDVVRKGIEKPAWMPLVTIQPSGNRTPLFLLPGWGGNVMYFHALGRHLGKDQPVYALQARGLNGMLPPYGSIEERVEDCLRSIKSVQPEGPYILGGHSMGAHLAFELAQTLIRSGYEVAQVFILDKAAPYPDDPPDTLKEEEAWQLLYYTISEIAGKSRTLSKESLRKLPRSKRIAALRREIMSLYGNSKDGATAPYVEGFFSVFFADIKTTYRSHQPALVPITLVRAEQQLILRKGESAGMKRLREEADGGWNRYAKGLVKVFTVSGNHNTMLIEPNVRSLAGFVRQCLDELS